MVFLYYYSCSPLFVLSAIGTKKFRKEKFNFISLLLYYIMFCLNKVSIRSVTFSSLSLQHTCYYVCYRFNKSLFCLPCKILSLERLKYMFCKSSETASLCRTLCCFSCRYSVDFYFVPVSYARLLIIYWNRRYNSAVNLT